MHRTRCLVEGPLATRFLLKRLRPGAKLRKSRMMARDSMMGREMAVQVATRAHTKVRITHLRACSSSEYARVNHASNDMCSRQLRVS